MNARQGVIIAMFLSMAVYLLANAQASVITQRTSQLKQTPKIVTPTIVPTPGFGGGTSGGGTGGAGGGF